MDAGEKVSGGLVIAVAIAQYRLSFPSWIDNLPFGNR
jgi:hypothetical protein